MQWELPEPYASMSPTDPRRRQYIDQRQTDEEMRLADIGDIARQIRGAWDEGRPRLHVAVPALHSRSTLDHSAPTAFSAATDVALVLSEAEQVGWCVDRVDYVFVPGTETGLAAGVRLTQGTVVAMVNLRRPTELL